MSSRGSHTLKSIDLFAGIGGIRMGFEAAFGDGIETVFASEFDEHAVKTYAANFDTPAVPSASGAPMCDKPYVYGDITQVAADDVPAFDICLAGFPCQAFSIAGSKKGFDDNFKGRSRGTLFFDVLRICERHKPRVIFCENVKGLVMHDRGRTFKVIKGALEQIGYTVYDAVLNSKDYGVAQNRERIYIVAFRNDVDSSAFRFPEPLGVRVALRDILDDAPVPSRYYLSDTYLATLERHKQRHQSKGNGFGYMVRPLDGTSGAIVCGGMGRERNLIADHREHSMVPTTAIKGKINDADIRKLTPREWARLQGFPDSYKLPLSDTHLYKQLGNSVTVPVIAAIAHEVKRVLERQG